ncbi:MAG: hypothetical protein Q4Q07_09570 [Tissierellia bacterium]|nr:hypothetical protein [Tissierellia bacterium]
MKLEDYELVKRYLYEATRYMEYRRMEEAKEDILYLLKEYLGEKEWTEENIQEGINRLGNPYTLAKHYETQGNFLITGRYYKLYMAMLKTSSLGMVLGQVLSMLGDTLILTRVNIKFNLESLLYNLLLTFFVTTFAFTMAERIKTKRILKSILEPWTADSLKNTFHVQKLNLRIIIYIFIYSIAFGKLLTDYYEYHNMWNPDILHLVPSIIFTIFLFRDALRMSHTRRRTLFYTILLAFDTIGLVLIIGLMIYLKGQPGYIGLLVLFLLVLIDISKTLSDYKIIRRGQK